MVEVPDSLRSVFSATVEEHDDAYVVEVPTREIEHDAIAPGETYRVAVLNAVPAGNESAESDATATGSPSASTSRSRSPDEDGSLPEPPVDEGEIREVTIESLGDQGDGIAKVERGYVVIVPDARPGDEPTVEIERVRRNVAFASVVDVDVDPGPS